MRGCARKVVVLRGTASQMFDEAYFLLRPGFERREQAEMLCEAQRIVDQNTVRRRTRRLSWRDAIAFAAGALAGALGVLLAVWV